MTGLFRGGSLVAGRRVPGTRLGDYLAVATLMRRHAGRRIDEVLPCRGLLWEKFLRPVLVAALTRRRRRPRPILPGAVMRETFAKGGRRIRPRVAHAQSGRRLRRSGAAAPAPMRRGDPLRPPAARPEARRRQGDRPDFDDGEESLGAGGPRDPRGAALDGAGAAARLTAPDAFRAIVNAHFRSSRPPARPLHRGPDRRHRGMGLRLPRPALGHGQRRRPSGGHGYARTLAALLWRDVAAVHRPRRSAAALPHRQGEARHLRRDAGAGCTAAARARRAGEPVPRRRLDRDRAAGDDRGRAALGRNGSRAALGMPEQSNDAVDDR